MMHENLLWPEGYAPLETAPLPFSAIQSMIDSQEIVEGMAVRCDGGKNLHITFRGYEGKRNQDRRDHFQSSHFYTSSFCDLSRRYSNTSCLFMKRVSKNFNQT